MNSDQDFLNLILSQSEALGLPSHAPDRFSVSHLPSAVNRVRRVTMAFGNQQTYSFIVKQVPESGRLEKFPSVIFPETRLQYEALFIREYDLAGIESVVRTPQLHLYDGHSHTLVTEDFGNAPSYGTFISTCNREQLDQTLRALGGFLGQFHAKAALKEPVDNPAAKLNRTIVFTHPITKHELIRQIWESQKHEGGSDLWQERIYLQEWFLANHARKLLPVLEELDHGFKSTSYSALTHGDLNGATLLMLSDGGIGVIDSEFADSGCLAIDLGTLSAHVWALRLAAGDAHVDLVHNLGVLWLSYWSQFLKLQKLKVDSFEELITLMLKHAGSELLTRVLGATYFPYPIPISFGQPLVEDALSFLLESEQLVVHLLTQSLPA